MALRTRIERRIVRAAGFTLVELLAVLVIISILFAFVLTRLLSGEDVVRAESTRQFLAQISAVIGEFENDEGDYPPSTFSRELGAPNKVNMGAEMLVIAIYGKGRSGSEFSDDRLGNTDDDALKASVTSFSSPALFEICDDWGNPIAYFHRRDYENPQVYASYDQATGEYFEGAVEAMQNPATGDPFNRSTYQLISAGPDGVFGPNPDNDGHNDDIANFKFEQQ
ncbi:MAG: type II secretion system protein [Planctomycetota bacterium]|nr:MAG: type II secretion system protein [Planctomycetota bacterium]